MNLWDVVTMSDLAEVLSPDELKTMRDIAVKAGDDPDAIMNGIIRKVSNRAREAILNNSRNRVDPAPYSIPETLFDTALDIIRFRLLVRFSQRVTDERKQAAAEAEQRLKDIASGDWAILSPDGTMPEIPGKKPYVTASEPAYDILTHGLFPSHPNRTRKRRKK